MDDEPETKARKACINCRRQKMKCRIDAGTTCRRCKRAGLPCVFVPRANASAVMVPSSLPLADLEVTQDLLHRVKAIEEFLDFPVPKMPVPPAPYEPGPSQLWQSAASLQRCGASCGVVDGRLWRRNTIMNLWETFHDAMPGLHFLPDRQKFTSPEPLLLAAMLYCSSVRGREYADLAPAYFTVLCAAIAQLSVPGSEICNRRTEESAFQAVLALVLAGLLSEAHVRETGVWISIAYRLVLEHCPPHDELGWRWICNGVQIVDLEHASLHLSCPVLPLEPPLRALQLSHRDPVHRLSRMMHTGLSHFSGRGLQTIWSCFETDITPPGEDALSPVDAAVIRDWARGLDDWLVEFSQTPDETDEQRKVVFRQYVLHRLVVLSIYHPARGCNLRSDSISLHEQHELLMSARATLKLHLNDKLIWTNWDLVIITWAAVIVTQAIEAGIGEPDDLRNIRIHFDVLRGTCEPAPNFRDKLVARLERSLSALHTPSPASENHIPLPPEPADYSWQIFDQAVMAEFVNPSWLRPAELQPM